MRRQIEALAAFLLARLREPGSQRAIAALAGFGGVTVTDEGWAALLWTIATLSAVAAVLLPERHATAIASATVVATSADPASGTAASVSPTSFSPTSFSLSGLRAANSQGVPTMLSITTLFGLFSAGQEAVQAVKDLEADREAGKLTVDDVAKHVANLAAVVAATQINATVTKAATTTAAVAVALETPAPVTVAPVADVTAALAPAGN